MHDTAIFIGRFQPLHNGHLRLLQQALACAHEVIVVLGSAWQARSPKNPFSWQERAEMMRQALPLAERSRLHFLPVRDYYNEARWVAAVRRGVAQRVSAVARIALVGHFKDATSSYLSAFPNWDLVSVERQGPIDATAVRDAYFGASMQERGGALAALVDQVPPSTLAFLHAWAALPHYVALREEWQMLRNDRQAWAHSPYPPVFVTVDAIVHCQGYVLLIRRGHAPGKGQWAVPGGFIEARETLWQSCLRELNEETHCDLPETRMRQAHQATVVFDHPDRSQRGRFITHAHYFDLGDSAMPPVRGDDDALQAAWVPLTQLAALEDSFFEDHFHMLDHFFNVTKAEN